MNKLQEMIKWYEDLDEKSLSSIKSFYTSDVYFKDPFNEIKNLDGVIKIYQAMFKELQNPKFVFIDVIEKDDNAFLTWDFTFKIKSKEIKIHGSSHLKFSTDGKVSYHRDYWDVGEEVLLKIPLVKNVYQLFRNKLSTH